MSYGAFLVATFLALGTIRAQAEPPCAFDTDGDGAPELVVPDDDGDGFCDFPTLKTHLQGTLTFAAGFQVDFRGTSIVEADRVVVEEGAELRGTEGTLRALTLVSLRDDVLSLGRLDLRASDDLTISARGGSLLVFGPTSLAAADRLLLEARQGGLTLAPDEFEPGGPFTLSAGNAVGVSARAAFGDIRIAHASIASRRVTIDAVNNQSVTGAKELLVGDTAILTTDRARTGLPVAGDVVLRATGPVVVTSGVQVDSGRNLLVATRRPDAALRLSRDSILEAIDDRGRAARIDLRGVGGDVEDDGTTIFRGQLLVAKAPVAAKPGEPEPTELAGITAAHNEVRKNVVRKPKTPTFFHYDPFDFDENKFAAACKLDMKGQPAHGNPAGLGENLFWESGDGRKDGKLGLRAVKQWNDQEMKRWTYGEFKDANCSTKKARDCAHYTQMIWANDATGKLVPTPALSCGVALCKNGPPAGVPKKPWTFVVCRYRPQGNIQGKVPYD
jgi:hypothetical protein